MTAVSLFCGAGGLDVGLEKAGFRTVAATDFDIDCMATMRAVKEARIPIPDRPGRYYFEDARLIEAPVQELRAADLYSPEAGDEARPDLLVGGPPCQPFSSAGRMGSVADSRGRLFEEFVRLAKALRPRAILFENVQGLVTARGPSGQPGEVIHLVRESFEEIGYGTTFALLNAADYGAPQRRIRCFMMATRLKPVPVFPAPTHAERPPENLFGTLAPWVPLADVLAALPAPSESEVVRPSPGLEPQLAVLPCGSGIKSRGVREATRPGGHWGYKQGTWITDPRVPARTVTAASTQDWLREDGERLRRLTWRECAAIQGFPSEWPFQGSKASRFRQIGNAVPSIFGEILGRSLILSLRNTKRRRAESAPFPDRFHAAIRYTQREHARNGDSRAAARAKVAERRDPAEFKGLGSDDDRLELEDAALAS